VTAAQRKIVAGKVVAVEQRHDREIVGQDIDRIVLGDREPGLEFARQIAIAVKRVRLVLDVFVFPPRSTLDPDLMIAAGARQQVTRQPPRICFEPAMHRVADRRWNRRHGTYDITAGG
jgi:hypothetical protein